MAGTRKKKSPFPEFVDILGTPYQILIKGNDEDPYFRKYDADGYCSDQEKLIVIMDAATDPVKKDETAYFKQESMKGVLRHEIVHAFFHESGLGSSCGQFRGPWAEYEEMVDWIARQGEKIHKAWAATGCLRMMDPEQYVAWTSWKKEQKELKEKERDGT